MRRPCACWLLVVALNCESAVPNYDTNDVVVQTFAGSGFTGYVDGQGVETMFDGTSGFSLVSDSVSNLFVLERFDRIRKITPGATVSTFYENEPNFSFFSMTIDHSNALWFAGWQFTNGGASFRVLARLTSETNFSVAYGGSNFPYEARCVDSVNNVYISHSSGNRIYRYKTNGVFEVFAGSGNQGSADGNGIFTSFSSPGVLAADSADNIYVWDSGNRLIRRINQNRDVVTVAGKRGVATDSDGTGTNASFNTVSGMCTDNAGNVIFACGSSIRKMTPETNVVTLAGSFSQTGYTNGAGSLARFNGASGVCFVNGTIFVIETANPRIRSITFDPPAQPVSGGDLSLDIYAGVRISGVVGRTYRIESSSVVNTNWTTEATISLPFSPYLWIDPSPLVPKKFYRAFLLP